MNFVDIDTYMETEAALRKVRDLHFKVSGKIGDICNECFQVFPCATLAAITKES